MPDWVHTHSVPPQPASEYWQAPSHEVQGEPSCGGSAGQVFGHHWEHSHSSSAPPSQRTTWAHVHVTTQPQSYPYWQFAPAGHAVEEAGVDDGHSFAAPLLPDTPPLLDSPPLLVAPLLLDVPPPLAETLGLPSLASGPTAIPPPLLT